MAAGITQSDINCPVTFHPGRNNKAPFEIMRIYSEAGGDIKKAVMSHLDSKKQVKVNCYFKIYIMLKKTLISSSFNRLRRINL